MPSAYLGSLPADDGFNDLLPPEPPWDERLGALERAVGRHPLYQSIDADSGSETEAQDGEGVTGGTGAGRAIKAKKEHATSEAVKPVKARDEKGAAGRSGARADGGKNPPLPAPSAKGASVKRTTAPDQAPPRLSPDADAMDVDEPEPLTRHPGRSSLYAAAASSRSRSCVASPPVSSETAPSAQPASAAQTSTARGRKRSASPFTVKPEASPSSIKTLDDRPPSSPVIQTTSSDAGEVQLKPPKPAKRRKSSVRADSSAALLRLQASRASAASSAAIKSGGKKKARVSLEAEVEKVRTLSVQKAAEQFKTISDLARHLSQFESVAPEVPKALSGTRICFVNTDHWRRTSRASSGAGLASSTPGGSRRNRFDNTLRTMMTVAARQGAVLVPPNEFTPPPFEVDPDAPVDAARAASEGWTTHIVPFVADSQRWPTFSEILRCLGPDERGIDQDELGEFVQIVKFDWIVKSVDAGKPVAEWPCEVFEGGAGDPRVQERKQRQAERGEGDGKDAERKRELEKKLAKRAKEKQRRELEEKERKQRQGARKEEQEDTDPDDFDEDDDGAHDGISPFGPQDFPAGESAAKGYFERQHSNSLTASNDSSSLPSRQALRAAPKPAASDCDPDTTASDPIEDADLSRLRDEKRTTPTHSPKPVRQSAIPGLEQQFALIDEHGEDEIERWLAEEDRGEERGVSFQEDDFKVISTVDDDNETEEENEREEEERRTGKKVNRKHFDPRARVKRKKGRVYACDDPSNGNRNGPNERVAKVLDLLSSFHEPNSFRQRGYRMAAGILRNIPTEVKRVQDLKAIRGIGDRLAQKIIEIRLTGTHRRISTFVTPQDQAARAFSDIYGIGSALAYSLWEQGARTVDDLRADPDKFGLHENQKIGLEHYEDLKERIPRDEVRQLYEIAKAEAAKIDPKIQLEVMGSYRRRQPDCGDIDLLLTRPTKDGKTHAGYVKKLWRRLGEIGMAQHTLSQPDDWKAEDAKVNGLCKLPGTEGAKMRRIDILGVPWDEMPAALIYFTGNDFFNRSLRLKARHLGYRLNQRGLYKNVARGRDGLKLTEGVRIEGLDSEAAIFKRLKVPYREPWERKP
ncbi:hypothetical protein JCM10213_005848 [Rhodosporidiobolus nylandii]